MRSLALFESRRLEGSICVKEKVQIGRYVESEGTQHGE